MRLVKNYLKLRKVRVAETYIKSTHGLTYILSRFLKASGFSEKVTYEDGYTKIYPARAVIRRIFILWCFLDAFSISVKFLFRVQLPFWLGFTPLIEEGLVMTSFTYRMSLPRFYGTKPVSLPIVPNLIQWTSEKNHVNIVIDASVDELRRRRTTRSFRQKELSEYIAMQKKWMRRLDSGNFVFIDSTDETVLSVHRKIVAALEKKPH